MTADGVSFSQFLRPEAGPVSYDKLQRRLKLTLDRIILALEAARSPLKEASNRVGDIKSIDTDRASRIFFVSGEPGSGKTTLYLTLKAMLNEVHGEDYRKDYEDIEQLRGLAASVRWLDALDLDVVENENENLLAAVLVRLFKTLEEEETALSKCCEGAVKDLEELATDIGMAWTGNLPDRGARQDPDAFSEEVIALPAGEVGDQPTVKGSPQDVGSAPVLRM